MDTACVAFSGSGTGLSLMRMQLRIRRDGAIVWSWSEWIVTGRSESWVNAQAITYASMHDIPILNVKPDQVVYEAGSFQAQVAAALLQAQRDGTRR